MTLGLVARSAVALSEQINKYFRVLKGTDPDNVYLRLPTAGSFEVRHSVTNAPVFQVTDAGMVGAIGGGNIIDGSVGTVELADGAVNSAKIADGSIVNADVSPSAAIVPTKLWGGGTADRVLGTTDGTVTSPVQVSSAMIADGTIVDVDVNSAANLAVSKLAHVGAGNVLKSNGTANVGAQVVNADVGAAAAVAITKLAHVGAGNVLKSDGSANTAGQVGDADVSALANIGVTKLAHVGAGNVLKSTGTANVGAQVVNADVSASAGIVASKLAAGGTANRVVATADGTAMAMQQVTGSMIADNTITAANLSSSLAASGTTLLLTSGVLGAPQSIITFTPIPQTARHLELRIFGRTTDAATNTAIFLNVNNDSTALYFGQNLYVTGSTVLGQPVGPSGTAATIGYVTGAGGNALIFGVIDVSIPNYVDTTNYVGILSLSHQSYANVAGSITLSEHGTSYYGIAAVTRLDVKPATGSWAAGTIISLYGWL